MLCVKNILKLRIIRVTVSENNGEIEFLRQVVPGGTNRSYGIQVAKMAGLPNSVISRAQSTYEQDAERLFR